MYPELAAFALVHLQAHDESNRQAENYDVSDHIHDTVEYQQASSCLIVKLTRG